jgi:hypothetical protein
MVTHRKTGLLTLIGIFAAWGWAGPAKADNCPTLTMEIFEQISGVGDVRNPKTAVWQTNRDTFSVNPADFTPARDHLSWTARSVVRCKGVFHVSNDEATENTGQQPVTFPMDIIETDPNARPSFGRRDVPGWPRAYVLKGKYKAKGP